MDWMLVGAAVIADLLCPRPCSTGLVSKRGRGGGCLCSLKGAKAFEAADRLAAYAPGRHARRLGTGAGDRCPLAPPNASSNTLPSRRREGNHA